MKKYLLLIIIALLPLAGLLPGGLPVTHDGVDHVARIANFYRALSEGVVVPRWAELLNWGYGHPILMFLYPFSSYTASFFHFIGFSYVDSLKMIFGLGYVASGIAMYLWAKEQFDQNVGFAAALLYLFAPYRFVDLYVRGAIGEHMAFIFPPLVLYFMIRYFRNEYNKKSSIDLIGVSVSFALLLLSHNAISLMFIPIFIIYGVYLSIISKKYNHLLMVGIFFIAGFLLSGFFTIPAFLEGKFTLRDIVTGNEYRSRFIDNPLKFLYGEWNYGITGQFTVQIGIAQIAGLLLLPFLFFRKSIKKSQKILLFILLLVLLFSLFIQLSVSNFVYEIVTIFKKFQFPWRFLSLTAFASAVLAACPLLLLEKKKRVWGVVMIATVLFVTTLPYWKAKAYTQSSDSFYEQIYNGTTDTGESAPIWSVRFMEKKPQAPIETISGKALIQQVSRTSTSHIYTIIVDTENARLRENTLYFPGWHARVKGKDLPIQFQDPSERGLITFELPKGTYDVAVVFEDTKLRLLSNVLTILTALALFVFGVVVWRKNEKK